MGQCLPPSQPWRGPAGEVCKQLKLCKIELQQGQVGGLGPPCRNPSCLLELLRVLASFSSTTQYKLHVGRLGVPAGGLTCLSTGPSVFTTFDVELKLAKCGLQACGGCKIGLVS